MKVKNLLLCAVLLTSVAGSATPAFAAEYPDSEHANTTAEIAFEKDDSTELPVDPDDPDKPIDPDEPGNGNGSELMISYASNLQFGQQKKSDSTFYAQGDKMKDGSFKTPFVSTKDSRGTERKGWSLTAALSKGFTDAENNELKGAELSLSNLYYADVEGAPTANTGNVVLGTEAQEVASADSKTGIGSWSVGLGKLDAEKNTTNGVKLSIPQTTAKNTATYTAEVTWELTADATN